MGTTTSPALFPGGNMRTMSEAPTARHLRGQETRMKGSRWNRENWQMASSSVEFYLPLREEKERKRGGRWISKVLIKCRFKHNHKKFNAPSLP